MSEAEVQAGLKLANNVLTNARIEDLEKRLAILRVALSALYEDTASYIRVNHLGDVHHNQSMRLARAALDRELRERP